MTVVYIDMLVAFNWLVDFLLLRACARLLHLPDRRFRLVVGALFGGCCSCVMLLPPLPWYASFSVKLVIACIMVLIAFPWLGLKAYFRQTALLFFLSALFAGIAFAFETWFSLRGIFVSNGVVYYAVPPLWLALLFSVSYVTIWLYEKAFRRGGIRHGSYELCLTEDNKSCFLTALYDSGNCLCDEFSGSPVLVVKESALLPILSPEKKQFLTAFSTGGTSIHVTEQALAAGWRLVPFHSLGGNGLLPAFRPEKVIVKAANGDKRDITGCYIALSRHLGRGDYQALLGNEILLPTGTSDEPLLSAKGGRS